MIGAGATSPSAVGAAFLIATCTFPTVLANASEPLEPHSCIREKATTVCHYGGLTRRVGGRICFSPDQGRDAIP